MPNAPLANATRQAAAAALPMLREPAVTGNGKKT
jgi:hypothetical protein